MTDYTELMSARLDEIGALRYVTHTPGDDSTAWVNAPLDVVLDEVRTAIEKLQQERDQLARHDAEVRAQALEDAAREYGPGKLTGIFAGPVAYTAAWLTDRAARIRKEGELS